MKKKFWGLFVALGLLTNTGILSASGISLFEIGSRAASLAGAFTGLADNSSAIYYNPAGIAFAVLAAFLIISIPFSTSPALSARSMVKLVHILAFAYAIPVVLGTRPRIERALLCTATAVTTVLAADLVRLSVKCGAELMQQARLTHPYIMSHPNVASMMAASWAGST